MKRSSKVSSSSSSSKAARFAHVFEPEHEHSGAADEEEQQININSQKAKFTSLYEDDEIDDADDDNDDDVAEEAEDVDGYELRQNPKKIGSKIGILQQQQNQNLQQQQQQKFVCCKCGKAFQSMKAMCGHMACHSEKERPSSNIGAAASRQKMVLDSQSDTESGAANPRRRSTRTKYKKANLAAGLKKTNDVNNNYSSGASGIEQEQEEVAYSLMMLSRDSSNWGGLNSIGDSSENNSVVLEARSIGTKLGKRDGVSGGYDNEMKSGGRKVKALNDSEFGYVGNGAENVWAVDVQTKNLRTNKFESGPKVESQSSPKRLDSVKHEALSELSRDGNRYSQLERPKMESYRMKRGSLNEAYHAEFNLGQGYSNAEMHRRFEQNQALVHSQAHQDFNGTNVASHKSFTAVAPYESSENSFEINGSGATLKGKGIIEHKSSNVGDNGKKSKHECPICFKVFKSGQALGGHRRSHWGEREASAEIKNDEVAVNSKQRGAQSHDFIDLNLPAPMEDEEASESMGATADSKHCTQHDLPSLISVFCSTLGTRYLQ